MANMINPTELAAEALKAQGAQTTVSHAAMSMISTLAGLTWAGAASARELSACDAVSEAQDELAEDLITMGYPTAVAYLTDWLANNV